MTYMETLFLELVRISKNGMHFLTSKIKCKLFKINNKWI